MSSSEKIAASVPAAAARAGSEAADGGGDPTPSGGGRGVPQRRTASTAYWVCVGLVVLSLVAGAFLGPVALALVALVSFGAFLLWLIDAGPGLAGATLLALLGAAWASLLGLYQSVAWLDLLVHAVVIALLAAVLTQAMLHHRLLADPARGWLTIGCAIALGLALASVWEMLEWIGHTYIDTAIGVGYDDTISDIATGGAGALVAGVVLARRQGTGR